MEGQPNAENVATNVTISMESEAMQLSEDCPDVAITQKDSKGQSESCQDGSCSSVNAPPIDEGNPNKRRLSDSKSPSQLEVLNKKIKKEHDYDITQNGLETKDDLNNSSEKKEVDESSNLKDLKEKKEELMFSKDYVKKYIDDEYSKMGEALLENIIEHCFLETGGKLIEYYSWKKRAHLQAIVNNIYYWFQSLNCSSNTECLIKFLESNVAAGKISDIHHSSSVHTSTSLVPPPSNVNSHISPNINQITPISISNSLKSDNKSVIINESSSRNSSIASPLLTHVNSSLNLSTSTPILSNSVLKEKLLISNKKHSISASLEQSSIGTREQIVERAKQEAYVMQRIAELRKNGVWSIRRLPKVQEPPRNKTHWDYLLEEMQWLAVDFLQERKWKRNSAKKCAKMVVKYHSFKECQAERIEKEEQLKLKRIAYNIAKMVKQFWSEVEKVAEAKQEVQLNQKRKKIQDMQLRFIVDKADHFTEKLAQEFVTTSVKNSRAPSVDSEMEVETVSNQEGDDEFEQGSICSDDDEETIAKEEDQEATESVNYADEVNHLSAESQMPIEQLLALYGLGEDKIESDIEKDESTADETEVNDSETDEDDFNESSDEKDSEEEIASSFLIESNEEKENNDKENVAGPNKEITDIAESIQPKGNTLSSVDVITKVPFLLKYQLREYQHIGLDWLVAMYEKSLSGILADEMGLGKTIQTISLIAHLACEKGIWGPHLIVVPTSVMLNWEMEFKKWCPALKILTYYGNPKERRIKRKGWTKPNNFHVCITSYKLVIQDHQSFRRQKWVYLILDEAQHIKNFKSQRWQMLLNFNSSRRLLLTGTPLQNNLMELWSLMHFLMPNVFQSHREFKDLFVNPVTGMIEGNNDYNENLIRRLHKVLRPFLLRRLKCDVEKQLPKKYEHIIRCSLSKRQRFLYDEFMSLGKTKETLASGNFLSVINILMQLRKVCNHPNLFDPRPTVSPFIDEGMRYHIPSLFTSVFDYNPLQHVDLKSSLLVFSHLTTMYDLISQRKIITSYYNASQMQRVWNSEDVLYVRLTDYKDFYRMLNGIKFVNQVVNRPSVLNKNQTNTKTILNSSNQILRNPNSFAPTSTNSIKIHTVKGIDGTNVLKVTGNLNSQSQLIKTLNSSKDGRTILIRTTGIPFPIKCEKNEDHQESKSKPQIELPKSHVEEKTKEGILGVGKYAIEDNVTKINALRKDKLHRLSTVNKTRCLNYSNYTSDSIKVVNFKSYERLVDVDRLNDSGYNLSTFSVGNGSTFCYLAQSGIDNCIETNLWHSTNHLNDLLFTPEKIEEFFKGILSRYLCIVPSVIAPPVKLTVSHMPSYKKINQTNFLCDLSKQLPSNFFNVVNIPRIQLRFQLPELRLIQYDCGKLQMLDKLLWQLKSEKHRVLIFTQMSRMLDIFELFLNYHGHTYLRLDGSTKIDQRQALMERFNADQRIFCFILSTRSGGVGVNLTGADTVIFYDSDWNPTMDAQAQDRCHRIGQTRDVHIYRLVSEKTVEENILKKAQQKKLLGDLAIEEGNFTTAFFKQTAIQELFDVETSHDVELNDTSVVQEQVNEKPFSNHMALEQALCTAEEETDVAAAKVLRAEVNAELDEFDENIPIEEVSEEKSPEEEQIEELISQLTPLELYALKFVESFQDFHELKQAEEEIEQTKQQWQKSIDEWKKNHDETRKQMIEEYRDSIMTCSREDTSLTKVFMSFNGLEPMPVWAPPTPPQDDNDLYIDYSVGFLYEKTLMPESQLPPVYLPKEHKRLRVDPSAAAHVRKHNISAAAVHPSTAPHAPHTGPFTKSNRRTDDLFTIPKSPFDRSSSIISRYRRELLIMKFKLWPGTANLISSIQRTIVHLGSSVIPPSNFSSQHPKATQNFNTNLFPKWLIHEEFSILLVLMYLQDLPYNLSIICPGHVPNWDFVAEQVNSFSCIRRSNKFCKFHFETVMVAKDDRLSGDNENSFKTIQNHIANAKQTKSKKNKNQNHSGSLSSNSFNSIPPIPSPISAPSMPGVPSGIANKGQINSTNNSSPIQVLTRVSNILQNGITDNNMEFTREMNKRFDAIKQIVIQKTQTSKSRFKKHQPKIYDHVSLLNELKIKYDQPLTVEQIAAIRADRISREKQAVREQAVREQQAREQQSSIDIQQFVKQQQIYTANKSQFKALIQGATSIPQSQFQSSSVMTSVAIPSVVQSLPTSANNVNHPQPQSTQVLINQNSASSSNSTPFIATHQQLQHVLASKVTTAKLQNLASMSGDNNASSTEQASIVSAPGSNLNAKIINSHVVNLPSSSNVHHVTLSQAQSLGLIGQGITSISSLQQQSSDGTSSSALQQHLQQSNTTQQTGQFVIQSNQTGQQLPVNVTITQPQIQQKLYAIAASGTNSSQAGSHQTQTAQINLSGQIMSSGQAIPRITASQYKQLILRQQQQQQIRQQLAQQQTQNMQVSSQPRHIHMQTIRGQSMSQASTSSAQRFQITSIGGQNVHTPLTPQSLISTPNVKQLVATTSVTSSQSLVGSQRILASTSSGHGISSSLTNSIIASNKGNVVASGNASIITRTIRADNLGLATQILKQHSQGNTSNASLPSGSSLVSGQASQIFVQQQQPNQGSVDQSNTSQQSSIPVTFSKSNIQGTSSNVSAIQISASSASLLSNSNTFTIPITTSLASNAKIIAQSLSGGSVTVVPSSLATSTSVTAVPLTGAQLRHIHLLQKRTQPMIQVSSNSATQQGLSHKTIVQQSGGSGSGGIVVSSDGHHQLSLRSSPNIISPMLQASNSSTITKSSNTFHLVPASAVQQLQQQSGPITVTTKAMLSASPSVTVQQVQHAFKQGSIIMQPNQQSSATGQLSVQSTNHMCTTSATSSSQSSANYIFAQQQQLSPIKTSSGQHFISVSSTDSPSTVPVNATTIKLLPTSAGAIAIHQGQSMSSTAGSSLAQGITTPKGHIIISGHAAASLVGQSAGIVASTSANAIASSAILQQVVSNQSSSANSGQTLTFAIRATPTQQVAQQQHPGSVHLSTLTLKNPASSGSLSMQHINSMTTSSSVSQTSPLVSALTQSNSSEHTNPNSAVTANSALLRSLASSSSSTKAIPIVLMQSSQSHSLVAQNTPSSVSLINISNSISNSPSRSVFPSNKITTATQTSGATLGSILSAAAKAASSSETQYSSSQTVTSKSTDSTLIEALMSAPKPANISRTTLSQQQQISKSDADPSESDK